MRNKPIKYPPTPSAQHGGNSRELKKVLILDNRVKIQLSYSFIQEIGYVGKLKLILPAVNTHGGITIEPAYVRESVKLGGDYLFPFWGFLEATTGGTGATLNRARLVCTNSSSVFSQLRERMATLASALKKEVEELFSNTNLKVIEEQKFDELATETINVDTWI